MVFTAISRVSLIEAHNDTDYSISVGQEKTITKTQLCFVPPY